MIKAKIKYNEESNTVNDKIKFKATCNFECGFLINEIILAMEEKGGMTRKEVYKLVDEINKEMEKKNEHKRKCRSNDI